MCLLVLAQVAETRYANNLLKKQVFLEVPQNIEINAASVVYRRPSALSNASELSLTVTNSGQ